MTTTHQLIRTDVPSDDVGGLTIHVAGRSVCVVMRGSQELLRGTFEQCYDYVNAARLGLTC
jgi:hypothetical protein